MNTGRCAAGVEALYSTTQAIERELDDLAWAAWRLGDDVQRGFVDLAFDLASFSAESVRARAAGWAGEAQESVGALGTGNGVELSWRQARNNFEVYNLVKNVRKRLRIDANGPIDLAALVRDAYSLGAYADLWAIEGLGHDYTDAWLDRGVSQGILIDGPAAALPERSLTMMHAGLGLAFAERMLPGLTPCSSERDVRALVDAFVAACDANGRPGYRGASYESLGLVARTWHPQVVAGIDRALLERDEDLCGYFWHGAGRALYFLPTYIVPILSSWRAADQEAPHELAHDNLYAGLAWAWTLVNMRHPQILAELLRTRERLARSRAFANGVASALVVAIDITPDDPYVTAFASYVPDEASGAAQAWNAVVAPAAGAALGEFHSVLHVHRALETVFHYCDLAALVSQLERGSRPTGA